jgi:uncharacterized phage-like protein YoqJ
VIVAFTGHRPDKLGGYGPSLLQDRVRAAVRGTLGVWAASWAISGMALGLDQWAVEECVKLGIPFTAAVPFDGQESRWPDESQRHYRGLLGLARNVVVVSEGGYAAWKMQKRNEWMVDNCDRLLAVWDGSDGGTANCVRYARSRQKYLHVLSPKESS